MNLEIDDSTPVFKKHLVEAEDKGLQLLNKTQDKGYGYYSLPCGHRSFLNYGSVRRSNSFKCEECFEITLKNRVKHHDLEFVSRFEGNDEIPRKRWCDYGFYRHISCGHVELLLHKNALNKKTNFCKECSEKEYKDLVISLGFLFVGFSRPRENGTLYVDVQLPCGHFKKIQSGNLKAGVWKCQECWESNLRAIASEQGIDILKRTRGAYYVCRMPCGCEQEVFLSNLKKGSCNCHNCNESYYNKSSHLYLIKFTTDTFQWLKLGFSKDIKNRVENFKVAGDYSYEIISVVFAPSGEKAMLAEKEIHKEFRIHRLDPCHMKNYHASSGFTECYPPEVQENLLNRLRGIRFD